MRAAKRKITDMTVDELKDVIHEAIAEDMEVWRETFEIYGGQQTDGADPAGGSGQGSRQKRRLYRLG